MTDTEYRFLMGRGFRIIRKVRHRLSIDQLMKETLIWKRIEKCSSFDHLDRRFNEYLNDEKTLADL